MLSSINICPICSLEAKTELIPGTFDYRFYLCDICGRFAVSDALINKIDKDKIVSYLYYNLNLYKNCNDKNAFLFIGNEKQIKIIQPVYSSAICKTFEELDFWYTINFYERIDRILLGLSQLSSYYGQKISFENSNHFFSLLFIKQYNVENKIDEVNIHSQTKWLSDYFNEYGLLKIEDKQITILPEGWKRIDELQKNLSHSKQVFVAMSFSDDMKEIQKAIENGIYKAHYLPHVMNKSEHNNQIVPELLYQIRQSKFVVAEFSTGNNGAYYEAGYAAGLGKEVIHICKKETFGKEGHFDIKQKSTILWEKEDEIAEALKKRIEATIGLGNVS